MITCTRVLVAHNHPIIRIGLRSILSTERNIEVVGEAVDGYDLQSKIKAHAIDILLCDLHIPGPYLETIIAFIHQYSSLTKVIILSDFDDFYMTKQVILSGIYGYIVKDEISEKIVDAIRTLNQGGRWYSREIFEKYILSKGTKDHASDLSITEKEEKLLYLIAQGWNNEYIASELCLGKQTVRNYISRLYMKLNVQSRAEAIIWARQRIERRQSLEKQNAHT